MSFVFLSATTDGLKALEFSGLTMNCLKSTFCHHQAARETVGTHLTQETVHPPLWEEETRRKNQKQFWKCVLFLLRVWVVGLCFHLVFLLACSIWVASCQSRVSRALGTQTFFFTFEFKIMHSAAGTQLASGKDGVEFHH